MPRVFFGRFDGISIKQTCNLPVLWLRCPLAIRIPNMDCYTVSIGGNMRHRILSALIISVLFTVSAFAQSRTCDELKMDIATKIEANGVKNYELTIVKTDDVKKEDNVVGSCEGGTKKIVYLRKDGDDKEKK